jgi:hypothetical protein
LEDHLQPAAFDCVMEYQNHARTEIEASKPKLLTKSVYCLGSPKNKVKVLDYVRKQMDAVIQIYRENNMDFHWGDSARVEFIPSGYKRCGMDVKSCTRQCGRHVLTVERIAADPTRLRYKRH